MRRTLLLTMASLLCASVVLAQAGFIGVFADNAGEVCSFDHPGTFYNLFVVHVDSPGATQSKFKVVETNGATLAYFGDSARPGYSYVGNTQTGVTITYPTCTASPHWIVSMLYFGSGSSDPCGLVEVVPHPDETEVLVWDCAGVPNQQVAGGRSLTLNPDETCDCTEPVLETNTVSIVPDYGITNCSTNTSFTFHIERADAEEMRGYDVVFDVDDAVVTVANVITDVTEDGYLSDVGSTAFYVIDNGGGTYTVSNAILGGSVGATGPGDLFTVEFTPVAEGTSPITIISLEARDLDNVPLDIEGLDGSVQIDCTVPTMDWPLDETDSLCYNTAPTFATFCFHDDVNLDLAEYQIDALGWNTIFTAIDTTDWCDPGWMLPGFGGLSEGLHTVYFRVKDDAGNWNGGGTPDTYSWQFVKDTVAPSVPSALVALPGHNKVHLTWTNPMGDASFAGVEVRRTGWGDYPQYGTPGPAAPSYPANETEGTFVVQTSLEAYDDSVTTRDIYYYSLFAYDCAGNYSALGVTAKDRSTSYFLGDIDPAMVGNGLVQILDLAKFSMTFGQIQGGPGWNMEGDFGPTDDVSRFGIPLPDDVVDFEDLMIFAMNYGNTSPALAPQIRAVAAAEALTDLISFKLVPISSEGKMTTFAVVVDNQATKLKGFAVTVDCGIAGELLSVTPSVNLSRDTGSFFGAIERDMGLVTLCVAALGEGEPLTVSGEVARLDVRSGSTTPSVHLQKIDLRDVNNRREEIDVLDDPTELPYVPKTTALMQNHPNPFNPTTTIIYDVATASQVTIEIFDVTGQRVRNLVSKHQDVGRYTVTWDGRDARGNSVHTGVYFYRMSAGGNVSAAKKMLLIK